MPTSDQPRDSNHSEELFRLSFTYAPFAMALIALDGRYERVNPAMCSLTGYTEAQLLGLNFADITHPDDAAADLAAISALVAGERDTVVLEKRYLTPTGDYVWAAKSATLMRREDGTPQYIISQLKDISARKRDEKILIEEHRRLRQAEAIGRVGSWEWDVSTGAITWSAGQFQLMGVDPGTFTGDLDASLRFIHADDAAAVRAAFDTCVRTGEPQRSRYRIIRVKDRACRWIDARIEAVHARDRLVRIIGVAADVTEQVESEQTAAAARSFQQAIMTASPDILFVLDLASRSTVWANRSIVAELGYTAEQAEDMSGDPAARLVPPEARAQYEASLIAARDAVSDDAAQLDLPLRHADGTWRWYSLRVAPLHRDEDGTVAQVVGVLRDTTASMAAQDALRESEAKFRQLAENVDVAFTLRRWEPDEFLYISPGYVKIFGYNPLTVAESPAESLNRIHHEDRARFFSDYWAVCRAGQPARLEYRVVRPDGEIRWIRATSSPVTAGSGETRRSAAVIADITETRQAEAALRSAQTAENASAAKNEFLGRMSHELRTPMNAILGFAQLLELDAVPGPQLQAVEHILSGGRHLISLIDDVLDIASIEEDRLEMDVGPVSISALLLETTALMSPLAAAAGVELVYQPAEDATLWVGADARRLRQVVLNLLSNGIKYNRPDGQVTIRCEFAADGPTARPGDEHPRQLDIEVSDTGLGIRAEDLPRLFTPFDRLGCAEPGYRGNRGGSGPVAAPDDDDGRHVACDLAIRRGQQLHRHRRARCAAGRALRGHVVGRAQSAQTATGPTTKTLLYIEDVASNVELMESVVNRRPHWQMVVAGNGRLGQELAFTARPDLILLDINLPDMTGLDVLRLLRADPVVASLPVVMVSADANPHQIERLLEAGADGYLSKPVAVGDILRLLDTHDPSVSTFAPAATL